MKGQRVTTRIAKARWAWSELTSPRFGPKYASRGTQAIRLQTLAKSGTKFEDLSDLDRDILVSLLEQHQAGFMPGLASIKEFVCTEWTKEDVERTYTIQSLSPQKDRNIPYYEFIKNPPYMVGGQPEWSDPRVSAKNDWPAGKAYELMEPAIALYPQGPGGVKMLVDGYAQSVIFMRNGKDTDRFLVWEPVM